MKKRIIAVALCMATIFVFGGCGKDNGTQQQTEAATETYEGPSSAQMEIDLEKQVKKLSDYNGITLTITGNYEVTDERIEESIMGLLPYYGITGVEVTDRDTVQEGDYVKVDYTGYHKDEAFEGGAATDVMIDVSNNMDVVNQTGYIDGFTDGLIGAKVGAEVSSDVRFPDEYPSNESLAGEMTTFKFKVKGIYAPVTMDTLTDDMIAEAFVDQSLTSKEDLIAYVRDVLENQAASYKTQASVDAAENYILDHSEVEIPEEYMDARLAEYQQSFERDYCGETQTLEEYLKANNTTLAERQKVWKESLEKQIKVEFLFGRIADLENIEVDADDFADFVNYIVSSGSSQMTTEDEVYDYYGYGNKEDGKKALRQLYRVNQAISFVVEHADVTVESETQQTQD